MNSLVDFLAVCLPTTTADYVGKQATFLLLPWPSIPS